MCLLWHSASSSRGAQWGRTSSTIGHWDPDTALQAEWLVQSYQRWMIVTALKQTFLKFLIIFFPDFFFFPGVVSSHSPLWLMVDNAEHLSTSLGLCNISLARCDRATGALC